MTFENSGIDLECSGDNFAKHLWLLFNFKLGEFICICTFFLNINWALKWLQSPIEILASEEMRVRTYAFPYPST